MTPARVVRAAWLWLVAVPACATTFYEGPRRPVAEIAAVESQDAVIDEVDGKDLHKIRGERSVYLLPPGPHVIGVSYLKVTPGLFTTRVATSRNVRVCLQAAAGHRYITGGQLEGTAWLWIRDRVGLGVGGEVGVRYDDVSAPNVSASFTRFPAIATLHVLVRASGSWFVLLAGGAEKDYGIRLSGSGDAAGIGTTMTGRIGGVGRVGLHYRWTDHFGLTFGVGYTRLTYDAPGGSLNASHASVWTNLHWAL
jgi:hypothetical protein